MTESADLDFTFTQNDDKDVHFIHQQSVSKLGRNELEDLFYQLYDENIHIKKKFNCLDNKFKVMSTRVMRLSRDHKCIDSANREEDQRQLRQLRQNEASLRAKITVLRGQLASHTRLHSAALSKLQRPRLHRCHRGCRTGPCSSCGDDRSEPLLDSSRTASQNQDQHQVSASKTCNSSHSESQSGGKANTLQGSNYLPQTNAALQEQVVSLREKIALLEKDMTLASERSRERIMELEGELAVRLSHDTAENVELIRARRISKQQEAIITSLQQEHQEVLRQLEASKTALAHAARDQDQMCCALERERQRNVDFQQEVVKLTHTCASLRDVQEQLNDLKKENAVLKEHSNKLLQLADSRHAGGDAEQIKSAHAVQEISALRVDTTAGERQLSNLCQEQALLQQQIKGAQNEVAALQKSLVESNEERYRLHQEVSKARKECLELQKELVKPCEERERLEKELFDTQAECVKLDEEISKVKVEIQEKQKQLSLSPQESFHARENGPGNKKKASVEENKSFDNISPYLSVHPCPMPTSIVASIPTTSATPTFSRTVLPGGLSQSQSQPATPRPRIGDAYLTLLEQTAIRPSGSPFPGVLSSHMSLQERFVELCLPTSSPPVATTPLTPMEDTNNMMGGGSSFQAPENVQLRSKLTVADNLSKQGVENRSPRNIGLADTQWELEKCRELLRVQCNLNSIYKKEVASLNNIVKSLTSPSLSNEVHN